MARVGDGKVRRLPKAKVQEAKVGDAKELKRSKVEVQEAKVGDAKELKRSKVEVQEAKVGDAKVRKLSKAKVEEAKVGDPKVRKRSKGKVEEAKVGNARVRKLDEAKLEEAKAGVAKVRKLDVAKVMEAKVGISKRKVDEAKVKEANVGDAKVCRVDQGKVNEAVEALLKWNNSQKAREKAQLLEDEQLLYLVISLKKIPDRARTNPFRIPLPHPLFPLDGSQEVCLFVNDLERGLKTKEAKAKVIEEGVPIAKVIGISKLKTDYYPHEAKRKLCGSYDLFLADDRILPKLPKLLGKSFFKKKKHPIPVTLTRQQWKGQLTAACTSTFMYVGGGSCSVIKVARVSQSKEEIRENVMAVVKGAAELVPKKWRGIQAIYLKTLESVALPLYRTAPGLPPKIDKVDKV